MKLSDCFISTFRNTNLVVYIFITGRYFSGRMSPRQGGGHRFESYTAHLHIRINGYRRF